MNISISVRKIFFSAKCCTKFSVLNNKSRYIEIYFVAFSLLRIKKKKRKKTLKYLKPHRKRNSIEMQSFHFYIASRNEISEYRYVPIKRNYIFKRQENFSKVGFIDESVNIFWDFISNSYSRSNPSSRIEFPLHNTISIRISHFSLRL